MTKKNINGWVCLVVLFLGVSLKAQGQTWTLTGSMGPQRAFHTATTLNSGEVLGSVRFAPKSACPDFGKFLACDFREVLLQQGKVKITI